MVASSKKRITDPKTRAFMEFFSKEMGVKFADMDTGEEIEVGESIREQL